MAESPKLELVSDEVLDEDEAEFRKLRRDMPGVKGASAIGIVAISVGKIPGKHEFFRTHKEFRPVVPLVDVEVGMEKQFFAVDNDMVEALAGIGITVSDHTLYLTVTPRGGVRIIPINSRRIMSTPEQKRSGCSTASSSGCGSTPTRRTRSTKCFPRPLDALPIRSGRS